jgi:hypothetical protein
MVAAMYKYGWNVTKDVAQVFQEWGVGLVDNWALNFDSVSLTSTYSLCVEEWHELWENAIFLPSISQVLYIVCTNLNPNDCNVTYDFFVYFGTRACWGTKRSSSCPGTRQVRRAMMTSRLSRPGSAQWPV